VVGPAALASALNPRLLSAPGRDYSSSTPTATIVDANGDVSSAATAGVVDEAGMLNLGSASALVDVL